MHRHLQTDMILASQEFAQNLRRLESPPFLQCAALFERMKTEAETREIDPAVYEALSSYYETAAIELCELAGEATPSPSRIGAFCNLVSNATRLLELRIS
jgi:hypothetical protein